MTAVGLAVVQRLLEPGFLPQVRAMGAHLSSRLTELCVELDLGGERGIGLLRALELKQEIGTQVVTAARDALEPDGLLLNAPRPSLLRFMPALNVTAAEIDRMIDGLRSAITLVHKRA